MKIEIKQEDVQNKLSEVLGFKRKIAMIRKKYEFKYKYN